MATGSRASSSTGSREATGQASAVQSLCPFCRTPTVVERTSRTLKNPNKQFYTCTNRERGTCKGDFFLWKPVSDDNGSGVDAATPTAGLEELENSMRLLSSAVQDVSVDARSLGSQQSLNKWLHVASLLVVVVLCIFMYCKA